MNTWGVLRTFNKDRLVEEMAKLGKGKRIQFTLSDNPESTEWVIIPKADYDQVLFDHAEMNRLKLKLKTISTMVEL